MLTVWLVDATYYYRGLPKNLSGYKKTYFQVKSAWRRERLGERPQPTLRIPYSVGALRLATLLDHAGEDVFYKNWLEAMQEIEDAGPPDILALSAVTPTVWRCCQLAKRARDRAKEQGKQVHIVLGGPHVRAACEITRCALDAAGFLGNSTEPGLFDAVCDGHERTAVAAILSRDDFDALADRGRYIDYKFLEARTDRDYCVNVFSTTGCERRCKYCQDRLAPAIELEEDEFKAWYGETVRWYSGVVGSSLPVHFSDSSLGGTEKHAIEVCRWTADVNQQLLETGQSKTLERLLLSCDLRADQVTSELAEALHQANFSEVRLGVDSTADEVLNQTGRVGPGLERVRQALETIRQPGGKPIYTSVYIVTGLPGSTFESDEQTFCEVKDLMVGSQGLVDEIKHHLYVPYPSDSDGVAEMVTLNGPQGGENLLQYWERFDRQSEPVYTMGGYPTAEIWRRFLETEQGIAEAWEAKLGGTATHEEPLYTEYNVSCYEVQQSADEVYGKATILFLSDLHLGTPRAGNAGIPEHENQVDPVERAAEAIGTVLGARRVDFLVIGGDLLHWDEEQENPENAMVDCLQVAEALIDRIVTDHVVGKDPRRVVIVPGNHDRRFMRCVTPPPGEDFWALRVCSHAEERSVRRRLAHAIPDMDTPDGNLPGGRDDLLGGRDSEGPLPLVIDRSKRVAIHALDSTAVYRQKDKQDSHDKEIQEILFFAGYVHDDALSVLEDAAELASRALDGRPHEDREGAGFERSPVHTSISVAVLHHPIAAANDSATEARELGSILINAAKVSRRLSDCGVQLVLHGHFHSHQVYRHTAIPQGGELLVVCGANLGATFGEPGFSLIEWRYGLPYVDIEYHGLGGDTKGAGAASRVAERYRLPMANYPWRTLAARSAHSLISRFARHETVRMSATGAQGTEEKISGWAHRLWETRPETIGTAFVLGVIGLAEIDVQQHEALMSRCLAAMEHWAHPSHGWGPSKKEPGGMSPPPNPQATAWVVLGLSDLYASRMLRDEGLRDRLRRLLDCGLQALRVSVQSWTTHERAAENHLHLYQLCLVLRALATEADDPAPDTQRGAQWIVDHVLSRLRDRPAGRPAGHAYRGCPFRLPQDPTAHDACRAAAQSFHTAHALHSLLATHDSHPGWFSVAQANKWDRCASEVGSWLMKQDLCATPPHESFSNLVVNEWVAEKGRVWHYLPSHAVRALSLQDRTSETSAINAVRRMMADLDRNQSDLWAFPKSGLARGELRAWMTYDSLKALEAYERKGGVLMPGWVQ